MKTGKSINELQNCVERLLKQLAAERKLRAEFEGWLEAEVKQSQCNDWNIKIGAEPIISETLIDVLEKYRELKAKHLPQSQQNKSAAK